MFQWSTLCWNRSQEEVEKIIFKFLLRREKSFLPLQPCSEGTGKKVDVFRGINSKDVRVPKMFGSKFFEVM